MRESGSFQNKVIIFLHATVVPEYYTVRKVVLLLRKVTFLKQIIDLYAEPVLMIEEGVEMNDRSIN